MTSGHSAPRWYSPLGRLHFDTQCQKRKDATYPNIANRYVRSLAAALLLITASCATTHPCRTAALVGEPDVTCPSDVPVYDPAPDQAERDEIFTLLAYAVVRKNWQQDMDPSPRGYNIGGILVDPYNNIACWPEEHGTCRGWPGLVEC